MSDWKDGDDIDPVEAKKATRELLEAEKHKRQKGSDDDLSTVDDAITTEDE